MTRPARRHRPVRWWSSARLLVTLGITATTAVVLACVVLIASQLLQLSVERESNERIQRETGNFAAYVRGGTLPSTRQPSPTVAALLRAYLSQQYPADDLILIGSPAGADTQLTLSRYAAADDRYFPPGVRDSLQHIGRDPGAAASGILAGTGIRWGLVRVQGPLGTSTLVAAVNDIDAVENVSRVIRQLLFASGIGLLLTALTSWVLAGGILRPIRRIREAADTISVDDLSRRVPTAGPDELAALAHTVNAMLDRVETAYRTQRDFLDDAGHELRTPLTVVQGNLDLLPDDPTDRAETIRLVQDELDRMTRIVEELLTLARADRPDFVRLTPTDLADLVIDVELKIEVTADRAWVVDPGADGTATLDQNRITQALVQFCANAVRFTGPRDRIEIGCTIVGPDGRGGPTRADGSGTALDPTPAPVATEHQVLWWVRDSGPGIPAGEEESIFERFHTARGQLRDGRGGTGLGLAIVSTIARAHGGRAFAYNASGGGACFCLTVPFVPAGGDTAVASGDDEEPGRQTDTAQASTH